MEKTTVYLPPHLKRALERAAKATGKSEAELIRQGVATVAAGELGIREPTAPLFDSGDADYADRMTDYMEGFGRD